MTKVETWSEWNCPITSSWAVKVVNIKSASLLSTPLMKVVLEKHRILESMLGWCFVCLQWLGNWGMHCTGRKSICCKIMWTILFSPLQTNGAMYCGSVVAFSTSPSKESLCSSGNVNQDKRVAIAWFYVQVIILAYKQLVWLLKTDSQSTEAGGGLKNGTEAAFNAQNRANASDIVVLVFSGNEPTMLQNSTGIICGGSLTLEIRDYFVPSTLNSLRKFLFWKFKDITWTFEVGMERCKNLSWLLVLASETFQ